MDLNAKKLLYDLEQAIERIVRFTDGKRLSDYGQDAMLRSAVERQFEIVGEALNRLERVDQSLLAQISDHRRIIDFRNILAHGYDVISDEIVWDIVQARLPILRREIDELKRKAGMT